MDRVTQKNKCRGRTKSCHLKGIGYLLLKACTKMFIVAPLDPTRPNRATMFRNVVNRPMASYKQKDLFSMPHVLQNSGVPSSQRHQLQMLDAARLGRRSFRASASLRGAKARAVGDVLSSSVAPRCITPALVQIAKISIIQHLKRKT